MKSIINALAGFLAVVTIVFPLSLLILTPAALVFIFMTGVPVVFFVLLFNPEIFGLGEDEGERLPLAKVEELLQERLWAVSEPVRACACLAAGVNGLVLAARVVGRKKDYSARGVGR